MFKLYQLTRRHSSAEINGLRIRPRFLQTDDLVYDFPLQTKTLEKIHFLVQNWNENPRKELKRCHFYLNKFNLSSKSTSCVHNCFDWEVLDGIFVNFWSLNLGNEGFLPNHILFSNCVYSCCIWSSIKFWRPRTGSWNHP